MEKQFLRITFLVIFFKSCISESPLPAVSAIINQAFSTRSTQINFIVCGNLDSLLQELLLTLDSLTYSVENCQNMSDSLERSSVVMFIDQDGLDIFNDAMAKNVYKFNTNEQFLVSMLNFTQKNEEKLIQTFANRFIYNLIVLANQGGAFVLKTFFPFREGSCHSLNLHVINRFVNDSFESPVIYPEKMRNFHQCPFKTIAFIYSPAIMANYDHKNSSFTLYGTDIELIEVVSQILNFTIDYDFDPEPGAWGVLAENGDATNGFLKLKTNKADLMIGMLSKMYYRTKFISFTDTIVFSPVVLMIPPGAPFSAFEKLFHPFKRDVWIYLLITFLVGLVFVTVLTVNSNNLLKRLLIGEEIKMPVMSMIVALVGGSQHVLPARSVVRILLMSL
jgi:hypothetical protein